MRVSIGPTVQCASGAYRLLENHTTLAKDFATRRLVTVKLLYFRVKSDADGTLMSHFLLAFGRGFVPVRCCSNWSDPPPPHRRARSLLRSGALDPRARLLLDMLHELVVRGGARVGEVPGKEAKEEARVCVSGGV